MSSPFYPSPVNFREALDTRVVKAILPTDLRSGMLSALPRTVRERAMFSSGVQNTDFLTRAAEAVDRIVSGGSDRATERTLLRQLADSLDEKELAKDPRLNLILDTQTGMAEGYGGWIEGQAPGVLDMWPCQELYRAEERKEPRDWPERWEAAGGEFYPGGDPDYPEGRMIAAKDDPIWVAISAFGLPYAPFDYNSGMDLRDVDREEAVELGVIDEDYDPKPQALGLNSGLQAVLGPLAAKFGLGLELGYATGGLAKLIGGGVAEFLGN
jgi:hypothetical protein